MQPVVVTLHCASSWPPAIQEIQKDTQTHTKDADTGFENILMEWYTL